jgi:hypothetical protein
MTIPQIIGGVKVADASEVFSDLVRESVERPNYEDSEIQYLGALKGRLKRAMEDRDQPHEFFDGMTYVERCAQNRRLANTYIKPKANKQETNFSTGSAHQKFVALVAGVFNNNFEPDITAFNEDDLAIGELGEAMEDILLKTEELDMDEEKKLRRQWVMFEQGEVFVEELVVDSVHLEKEIKGKFDGKFRGVEWTKKLKKSLPKFTRNVIRNEKVYLGNIHEFDIENQPFLFTVEVKPYEEVKDMYGEFEMFKYVSKDLTEFMNTASATSSTYFPFWSLTSVKKGYVEILKYQNKGAKEFQCILNGVPMFPIGFPMPWKHGEYNLVKQVSEMIDEHFAYGKSVLQRLKTSQALEDEFWRLAILKGQQGAVPPMINNTGRVLSSRIFLPGTITNNIPEGKLKRVLEDTKGIENSEIAILQMFRDNINENSTSEVGQGQAPKGNPTATQIDAQMMAAEKLMGLSSFAGAMLEKKLSTLRLYNVLEKWFDPTGTKVDDVRRLVNKYRSISVEKSIDGQGVGQEIVQVTDEANMPRHSVEVLTESNELTKKTGIPTTKIYLNRDAILSGKYLWRITVIPQPKKTSNLQKIMFRNMLNDFLFSPNVNLEFLEDEVAKAWGKNPSKAFKRMAGMPAQGIVPPGGSKEAKVGASNPEAMMK